MLTGHTKPRGRHAAHPTPAENGNGVADHPPHDAPPVDGSDAPTTTARAERIVDDVAERVGRWTATAGHALLRWGARAREEAEDIWAEAQDLRHRSGKP